MTTKGKDRVRQVGLWLAQDELDALEKIQETLETSAPGVRITPQAAIRHAVLKTAEKIKEQNEQAAQQ